MTELQYTRLSLERVKANVQEYEKGEYISVALFASIIGVTKQTVLSYLSKGIIEDYIYIKYKHASGYIYGINPLEAISLATNKNN